MKIARLSSLVVLAILGLMSCLRADLLYMKDGRQIEGKVISETTAGYVVEIDSGTHSIRVFYARADVDHIAKQAETSNDRLMLEYNHRLVDAAQKGAEGYRDLAHWCEQSDALTDQRKAAWRAVIGLKPDDVEAHAALGLVKAPDGSWESMDQKMAQDGFVRQGNTWVPAAAANGNANAAANAAPQLGLPAPATPATPLPTPTPGDNSLLDRSGFNAMYGGTVGYTAEVTGPGVEGGTIFYGRTGYPYLSLVDAAGLGIYVPMYSYPGSYFLVLPPVNYTGLNYWSTHTPPPATGLTGPLYPPASAAFPPRDRSNLLVENAQGKVLYQGANYTSTNAMGYDSKGIQVSPAKRVVVVGPPAYVNAMGYGSNGVVVAPFYSHGASTSSTGRREHDVDQYGRSR
ncbi:MAG: hypothetical protein ACREJ2_13505 [Planctomycetota bacterium]